MVKVSVSESEIHPCFYVTTDFSQYSEEDDIILEMTEEEFEEIDQACIEFESAMSIIYGKILEKQNETKTQV